MGRKVPIQRPALYQYTYVASNNHIYLIKILSWHLHKGSKWQIVKFLKLIGKQGFDYEFDMLTVFFSADLQLAYLQLKA